MSEIPGGAYLENQAVIEAAIRYVSRTSGLRGDDAEEFAAHVRLRFVEAGDSILAKFQGRSSLPTYLTVVIRRQALDYQASRWGRWRASALARGNGPAAMRLEELTVRDGRPIADALAVIEREMGPVDRAQLEALAPRFPLKVRRQYEGEEMLEHAVDEAPDAERLLVRDDEAARFARVKARLAEILARLDPADRLVVQLKFEQNLKVADIARLQQVDQKRLYRRLNDVLAQLRAMLEAEGVDASGVRDMLEAVAPEPRPRKLAQPVVYMKGTRHDH